MPAQTGRPAHFARSGRSICRHSSLRWGCVPSALQGSSDTVVLAAIMHRLSTQRALGQQLLGFRCAHRPGDKIYSLIAPANRQQQLDPACQPRGCRRISLPLPPETRILGWTRQSCWKSSATGAQRHLLRYRVEWETADKSGFLRSERHYRRSINQDSKRWYRREEPCWPRCWVLAMNNAGVSPGWTSNTTTPLPGRTNWC